jgi:NADH-quinone oxidoreductase subunit N
MYFADATDTAELPAGMDLRFAVSVNALALLLLGIFPSGLMDLCSRVLG